ncbi:TIGR03086 family metal-binding protein [Pseudonocardia acaciae]|uniref:TIGR03086 family metal-binding protein n=1 Tax=Pseudonocardia acaciae TaxID=551276 RepID=UPI00048B3CF8|nr:TIGR03086 family metal-binding protein [Pseudonocardia acaciae]
MNLRTLYDDIAGEATALIGAVDTGSLGLPTPCTEWTVRDLVNHMVATTTVVAFARERDGVTAAELRDLQAADHIDADHTAAWKAAAQRLITAFADEDALRRPLTLAGLGEQPGEAALSIAVFDLGTHCTDLAHATGRPMPTAELLEQTLAIGRQVLAERRDPALFGPERPAPAGAPIAVRLLAFAGREV